MYLMTSFCALHCFYICMCMWNTELQALYRFVSLLLKIPTLCDDIIQHVSSFCYEKRKDE